MGAAPKSRNWRWVSGRPLLEQRDDDDVAEACGRAEVQVSRSGSRQAAEERHERDRRPADYETAHAVIAGRRSPPCLAAVSVPPSDPRPKHAISAP